MKSDFSTLKEQVIGHFLPNPPKALGVAVSGGSDSVAVLTILSEWASEGGPRVMAATVDHGLRPEARDEAAGVARLCADLGVQHEILTWGGWDHRGNLQDAARRARYDLLIGWAEEKGLRHIVSGHTADDQAETFLMRLAREAGVDGLSAMQAQRRLGRVTLDRPALGLRRADLQGYLRMRGIGWVDDPSNHDVRFDRVRMRQALELLEPLGIDAGGLARVAQHLGKVRETLYWYAFLAAREMVHAEHDTLVIARKPFRALHDEIARRILQSALQWISGAPYAPRGRSVDMLMESLRGGTGMTLHGAQITLDRDQIRISRELNAALRSTAVPGDVWDNRWIVFTPDCAGCEVGALTLEGLSECPDWRDAGLPGPAMAATPALRRDGRLVAAPVAGLGEGVSAKPLRDAEDFFAALLSH